MEKNLKSIRKQFKDQGIFYTGLDLAEALKKYADFPYATVYDPTCGQGNLLSVFPDDIAKYGQEISVSDLVEAQKRLTNFIGRPGDTLTDDAFPDMKFDLIVANPPFSLKWDPKAVEGDKRFQDAPCVPTASRADYAFILHILHHLEENGKAIVLNAPGILFRAGREGQIRQWLIEQNFIERIVSVPGGKFFVDTSISTCILVLNKHKSSTDVIFEDMETGEEKTVTLEEIQSNGFTLSVGLYIQHEPEKEEVDAEALAADVRRHFLSALESQLKVEQMMCQLDGRDMSDFIRDAKAILEKYETQAS